MLSVCSVICDVHKLNASLDIVVLLQRTGVKTRTYPHYNIHRISMFLYRITRRCDNVYLLIDPYISWGCPPGVDTPRYCASKPVDVLLEVCGLLIVPFAHNSCTTSSFMSTSRVTPAKRMPPLLLNFNQKTNKIINASLLLFLALNNLKKVQFPGAANFCLHQGTPDPMGSITPERNYLTRWRRSHSSLILDRGIAFTKNAAPPPSNHVCVPFTVSAMHYETLVSSLLSPPPWLKAYLLRLSSTTVFKYISVHGFSS